MKMLKIDLKKNWKIKATTLGSDHGRKKNHMVGFNKELRQKYHTIVY